MSERLQRFWNVALGLNLAFLATVVIANAATPTNPGSLEAGDYLLGSLFLLAAYVWVPLRWQQVHSNRSWPQILHDVMGDRLRLQHLLRGVALGVAISLALFAIGVLLLWIGWEPDAGTGVRLGEGTWPILLIFPLVVGVGEEVFFRGFLQRHLGWIPQGILFAALHLPAATPLHVLVPLVVGLGFGYLVHRGTSLWVTIAAHASIDAIQLAVGNLR